MFRRGSRGYAAKPANDVKVFAVALVASLLLAGQVLAFEDDDPILFFSRDQVVTSDDVPDAVSVAPEAYSLPVLLPAAPDMLAIGFDLAVLPRGLGAVAAPPHQGAGASFLPLRE